MTGDIRLMTHEDAPDVALLHIHGIAAGFISSLGREFVTSLYEAIADSSFGFGFVECRQDQVVGFVAFTTNLSSLYKSIVRRNGFRFGFLLATKMVRWSRIKRVFETLLYPNRIKHMNLPDAELLSIAVADHARGQGIAQKLIERGLEECRIRKIDKVKVMVAQTNTSANRLYQKCGFKLAAQMMNHHILSNIYVIQTTRLI